MIKIVLVLLLGYLLFRIFRGKSTQVRRGRVQPTEHETHRDPVCGRYVAEDDAVIGTLEGERHYFCSMACLEKFQEQLPRHTNNSTGGNP